MKALNRIHLNGLRAVESVHRLGSLQAAASELGVTVGAVSQQVIRTEAQLGRPLFSRTAKGLVPLSDAAPVFAALAAGFESLNRGVILAEPADDTRLTVSVAPVFAARWLVPRLDSLAARHPEITLRIDATTALLDLDTSDVDIGIRVGRGDWPGVVSELLLPQKVFPVCAPALATGMRTPADLLSLPVLIDGQAMFSWDVWLKAAGLQAGCIRPRHVFNEASLCLDAAIAGQGVFLGWQTLAADALAAGRLVVPVPIAAATGFGHFFVRAPGRRETRTVRAFKIWLRDALAESLTALPLG
ncbi:transcriptional regulator, LysR family [Rhizobium sp. RU20A]|uniref:LysR substrate-binding domain-containing protein n=1 Tax=Rhizobium sp. RU20A TaxID=1907412 RepID=UPI0009558A0C|nr:LysR substrate-binding domain-containing protein [Rhizobium sp. RU20A]SIR17716.1 transcriptional regulator, LysR family [Rhizobium sp. RU20A]